jgi:hypothetical protein
VYFRLSRCTDVPSAPAKGGRGRGRDRRTLALEPEVAEIHHMPDSSFPFSVRGSPRSFRHLHVRHGIRPSLTGGPSANMKAKE